MVKLNSFIKFDNMEHQQNPTQAHHGRNIKRFREMLGIKQEALADMLGSDWSQKKVSMLESKEQIEESIMQEVAQVLKVPVQAIQHFNEEKAFNVISNTFNDHSANNMHYQCTFNPIDKLIEVYDALLKSERERIALLERMLGEKK